MTLRHSWTIYGKVFLIGELRVDAPDLLGSSTLHLAIVTGVDGLVGNSKYEHFTTEINGPHQQNSGGENDGTSHSMSHEAGGRVGDQQKFEGLVFRPTVRLATFYSLSMFAQQMVTFHHHSRFLHGYLPTAQEDVCCLVIYKCRYDLIHTHRVYMI